MRLDKFLSDMGAGTRSAVRKDIKSGRVTVDGITVKDPASKVTAGSEVAVGGVPVAYEEFVYYMMNKPAGVISASDDPRESTVVDLIEGMKRRDLFPAGRLDRDTEGLLLITNDGALAHRLLSPKHHVDKTYYVRVNGEITEEHADMFRAGLSLPDGLECLPAELRILSHSSGSGDNVTTGDGSELLITIREGKFHQIKRMFMAVGCEVVYLKRLSMGTLELDEGLAPGEYRRLTQAELDSLKEV